MRHHVEKYTEEQRYEMLRFIDHRAIKGGNVRIDAYGAEKYSEGKWIYVFSNHQGLFDVLAIMEACPTPFSLYLKKKWQKFRF